MEEINIKNHEKGTPGTARAFNSRFGLKINEAFLSIREIFPSSLQLVTVLAYPLISTGVSFQLKPI